MWHYLKDRNIAKTTNKLEGYFSELKQQYGKLLIVTYLLYSYIVYKKDGGALVKYFEISPGYDFQKRKFTNYIGDIKIFFCEV
jgi:hypothetical protein